MGKISFNIRKLLSFSLIVLSCLGLSMSVAHAMNNNQTTVQGPANKTIYKVGRTVDVTGTVNGDIFCAGQTVTIDANVNGDVICTAQTITVDGIVNGNLRLAGQTITLGSKNSKNASLVAQDVTVQNNSTIGGDLSVFANSVILNGIVGRDVTGTLHNMTVNNQVGRDLSVRINKLTLGSSAVINGNVDYTSPTKLTSQNGAVIDGTTTYRLAQVHHRLSIWAGPVIIFRLIWLVGLLVLGLVLVALFPKIFDKWGKIAKSRVWMALLIGFISMFAVPLIILILSLTVIGIPLAMLVILGWLVTAILSVPVAAYFVGNLVLRKKIMPVIAMLVGSLILVVISMLPVIGFIVMLLAYWFSTGVLLMAIKSAYKKPNHNTV